MRLVHLGTAAALVAAVLSPACRSADRPAHANVAIVTPAGAPHPVIELTGLSRDELRDLDQKGLDAAGWQEIFRVGVEPFDPRTTTPAVAGRYVVIDGGIRFVPAFPLEPGRRYYVQATTKTARLSSSVAVPGIAAPAPTARVVGISPGGETLPENLLRLYVWFSAPMSRGPGLPHVTLIDERAGEVKDAFLPVDGGFWNHDFTRYTLFFDPGRVKEGILRTGRPLMAGRGYRIRIATTWRDAHGAPLLEPFERRFTVGPARTAALDMDTWRIAVPSAGTRDALVITAPAALDRAIALRAIGVNAADGSAIDGDASLDPTDTRWTLVPRQPWTAGAYRVVALDTLEDPAGNRIGRAFEVPIDDRATPPAPRLTRTFTVAPPT
jgi:hypothetical protein